METFPFAFVALLALCVMPSALALKCEVCSNIPIFSGWKACGSDNPGTITCPPGLDRCMTLKGKMNIPDAGSIDIELKNCSSSVFICPKDGIGNLCNILNGTLSPCSLECCEGDMCNEAVRLSAWLASISAILMALYLNVFN